MRTRATSSSSTSANTLELSGIAELCCGGANTALIFPARHRASAPLSVQQEQRAAARLLSAIGAAPLKSSGADVRAAKEAFDRAVARASGVGTAFASAGMAGRAGSALTPGLASRATWLRAFAALTYSIEGASVSGLRARVVSRERGGFGEFAGWG